MMKARAREPIQTDDAVKRGRQARYFSEGVRTPTVSTASKPFVLQRKPVCACGGGCLRCQEHQTIQPKLAISTPGDHYEQEADRQAEQVMRGSAFDGHDRAARELATAADAPDSSAQPLGLAVRTGMESSFGQDFSQVRVHADAQAAAAAQSVNALAYTTGNDIVFGAGQFAPETAAGRRLLAHELAHVVQQRNGGPQQIARQTPGEAKPDESKEKTPAETPKSNPEIGFGSPKVVGYIFDDLILKLPARWQEGYKTAKRTNANVVFDPSLGRDLAYRELMAFFNLYHALVFTQISAYKPEWSKSLEIAEDLSGVSDTYLNLASLALHLDLKKYLEKDLPDHALRNLGWTIIYGLGVQGGLVGLNILSKEDLDFTSLLSKAAKKYTDAPRDFARPYQLKNIPDPRWSAYPFYQNPGEFSLKTSNFETSEKYDPAKPSLLNLNLGFNFAQARDLYPEKEEDKKKYKGFEAYPYLNLSFPIANTQAPAPTEAGKKWLTGVFIGDKGFYTQLEGGQSYHLSGDLMETYMRGGLFLRELGPLSMLQVTGEYSYRPDAPEKTRERLNAATTINLLDNRTWQATVGGNLGYLFPGTSAAGGIDWGAQASLYYKWARPGAPEPLKTGFELGATQRSQDPFNLASPELFSVKGSFTLFDLLKFSVIYQQVTGDKSGTALPKDDFLFLISPGPAIFPFSKK